MIPYTNTVWFRLCSNLGPFSDLAFRKPGLVQPPPLPSVILSTYPYPYLPPFTGLLVYLPAMQSLPSLACYATYLPVPLQSPAFYPTYTCQSPLPSPACYATATTVPLAFSQSPLPSQACYPSYLPVPFLQRPVILSTCQSLP